MENSDRFSNQLIKIKNDAMS